MNYKDLIYEWDTGINIRQSSFVQFGFKKIRTNRTYVHMPQYAKHGLGYCDLVYYKWQRHDYKNPTKKDCLKSYNL